MITPEPDSSTGRFFPLEAELDEPVLTASTYTTAEDTSRATASKRSESRPMSVEAVGWSGPPVRDCATAGAANRGNKATVAPPATEQQPRNKTNNSRFMVLPPSGR